jgi:transcriptional regulator with XRE-family HTH domain
MTSHPISGSQITAARALTGISQAKLAVWAKVQPSILRRLEARATLANDPEEEDLAKICRALEELGAVFIDEKDGAGAGVRLKFGRSQTRAIDRWENEGGAPADDDVP